MAFLPRQRTHRFIVTSPTAPCPERWGLTLHTPAGFEDFVTEAGQLATPGENPSDAAPDLAEVARIAASYGIEILGPPLTL